MMGFCTLVAAMAASLNHLGLEAALYSLPPGTFQRERLEKRLEIGSRLPSQIDAESRRGDRTGRCIAEMGREDLAHIRALVREELRQWKTYPLAPGVAPTMLNVKDFGVKGDGAADDAPAFARALVAVRARGGAPTVLEIPAGVYRFGGTGRKASFRAEGLANCVIRGESQETVRFVFSNYAATGVELFVCTNVTLANVELSLAETPFAQGTIESFDKELGTVDIVADAGTLLPTDMRLSKRPHPLPCALFTADGRQVLGQEAFFDRRAERFDADSYRVYLNRRHVAYRRLDLQRGWKLVICDRDNEASMVRARGSSFCNFDHVRVRNSRAAAFALTGSRYPTLWRVGVVPKAGMMISSNADGAFVPRGAFVAHSEFIQPNDDGCNCLSYGRMIRDVENGDTVVAEGLKGHYGVGDLMLIVSSTTGDYLWTGRVREPLRETGTKWHRTVFDTPIPPDVKTLKSMGRLDWTETEKRDLVHGRVRMNEMADQLYRPYAWGVSFVLSDCTFKSLRGTGAVVQCANALIENCRFESINTGVSLTGLLSWNEGPAPYNVVVRNCSFAELRTGVSVVYRGISGKVLPPGPIRNVDLKDNRFQGCARDVYSPSLSAHSVEEREN